MIQAILPDTGAGFASAPAPEARANPRGQSPKPASADRVVRAAAGGLTREQQAVVAQLAEIDRHVRAHEQAHLAAAGGYARGGPSFSYVTGPDGRLYAVGGEVSIDTSPVAGSPEATIRKAIIIQAAANAPADPSTQDREVAAAAAQMETDARLQLAAQQAEQAKLGTPSHLIDVLA